MRLSRTRQEVESDTLLSLILLDMCADDSGAVGDRLKTTKLLFLAAIESSKRRLKGLNYSFYRYTHGPFTRELYATWEELSELGYLDVPVERFGIITVTEEGRAAARHFRNRMESRALPGMANVTQVFSQVADTFSSLGTAEILRCVYDMEVVPVGWQQQVAIRDVPNGAFFTCILEATESLEAFEMDEYTQSEFREKTIRPLRPERISDEEYDAIYRSALSGVRARKNGGQGTIVSWPDLERKLTGES